MSLEEKKMFFFSFHLNEFDNFVHVDELIDEILFILLCPPLALLRLKRSFLTLAQKNVKITEWQKKEKNVDNLQIKSLRFISSFSRQAPLIFPKFFL